MFIYFFFLIIIFKTIYTLISFLLKSQSNKLKPKEIQFEDFSHSEFNKVHENILYIFPEYSCNKKYPNSNINIKKNQDIYSMNLGHSPLRRDTLESTIQNYEIVNKANLFNVSHSIKHDKSTNILYNIPYIVKLEMRTKNIKNNLDNNLILAYHNITIELIKEFHPSTCMVVGNTIILLFSNDNHIFKGSRDKLNSVIASFASSILSLKLNKPCSFISTIIQSNNMHPIHPIYNIYKMAKSKNITPYFFKYNQNKYIKFTLNRIKLNNNYYKLFNMGEGNIKDETNLISFGKFLEIDML